MSPETVVNPYDVDCNMCMECERCDELDLSCVECDSARCCCTT